MEPKANAQNSTSKKPHQTPKRLLNRLIPKRQQRGVAIIMVMSVLAGLMALAAPFVFSMILHSRSARGNLNTEKARIGAEASIAHGMAHLHNLVKHPGYDSTPDVDTLAELKVDMVLPGVDLDVANPQGLLWSTKIEDEQGKINLHTAPPTLLGNLLGSSILSESIEKDAVTLFVNNGLEFYSDGDEKTVDGFLSIGTDLIRYSHVKGNQIFLVSTGQSYISHSHRSGALVSDGRGRFIAQYSEGDDRKTYRPFRSIYEIKAIANHDPQLAIRPDEFAAMERFITIHSRMGGPSWGRGELIRGQNIKLDSQSFHVENGEGFGPGARLRIVQNGKIIGYNLVQSVRPSNRRGKSGWIIRTARPHGFDRQGTQGNGIYIEPMLRHPININTAPYEILVSCLVGLSKYATSEAVTRAQAEHLAGYLSLGGKVYTSNDDLKAALDEAYAKGMLSANLRDAVYINATEANSPKLRTSTVTFSYRSYGAYTIEGSGVINGGNGYQLARHTLRQIVTLPSPPPGRFVLRTQEHFQHLVEQGQAARTVTWPIAMGPNTNRNRQTGFVKLADPNRGDIRLDVGEVGEHSGNGKRRGGRRGRRGGGGVLDEWVEHCDNASDKAYFQEGFDFSRHGPWKLPGVAGPNGFFPTTSVELWYKPFGGGQSFIFDQGLENDRNRTTFSYEPGKGFVIRIYDANLEGKSVSYTYQATLNGNTWYHIAGSWRSSHPNGQEVRFDGQLTPKVGEVIFKPGTKLAGDIDLTDIDSLEIEDGGDFPEKGAVKVGEEIIEYGERNGSSLTKLRRGTRLSAAAIHDEGEFVMPFGYTCRFRYDLPVGGAVLSESLEAKKAQTRIDHPGDPKSKKENYILHTETGKIEVDDASLFPKAGYIIAAGEIIYYGSRSATEFKSLKRGQTVANTTTIARNLRHRASVVGVSFQVSKRGDYPIQRNRRNLVQLADEDNDTHVEWLTYKDIVSTDGKHFFIGVVGYSGGQQNLRQGPQPPRGQPAKTVKGRSARLHRMRGQLGTSANLEHDKKTKVIPVVEMSRKEGPIIGDHRSPRSEDGSAVSVLTKGQRDGDLNWIRRSHVSMPATRDKFGRITGWYFITYMGLNDFVSRPYSARNSRILKFPSGEMPEGLAPVRSVGSTIDGQGQLHGYVDEIKVLALGSRGGKIAMNTSGKGLDAGANTINVESTDAHPVDGGGSYDPSWPKSGIIRIGDELIGYTGSSSTSLRYYADVLQYLDDTPIEDRTVAGKRTRTKPNIGSKTVVRLTGLIRGALGTANVAHPPGVGVMLYDAAPISILKGTVAPNGDSFSVVDGIGFPAEGYAWINDEVLSYQQRSGSSFSGCQPFRGSFGTSASGHAKNSIVQALPFRYWDRNASRYDGEGLAYIQAGYSSYDAIWDTVDIKTVRGSERSVPNYVLPRILVRFDRKPKWNTIPTNEEGGIYEFEGAGEHFLKGLMKGRGVQANQIEIRVYWKYHRGAFHPGQDWKRTFGLDELRGTYHSPMDFRRLEQIERR